MDSGDHAIHEARFLLSMVDPHTLGQVYRDTPGSCHRPRFKRPKTPRPLVLVLLASLEHMGRILDGVD